MFLIIVFAMHTPTINAASLRMIAEDRVFAFDQTFPKSLYSNSQPS